MDVTFMGVTLLKDVALVIVSQCVTFTGVTFMGVTLVTDVTIVRNDYVLSLMCHWSSNVS
jgi:hypothetical protein